MENKQEIIEVKKEPLIPGVGVAGQVLCPLSLMAPKMCVKQGCELWVELKCGDTYVARCSLAWIPVLSVEIRQAIDKLKIQENK